MKIILVDYYHTKLKKKNLIKCDLSQSWLVWVKDYNSLTWKGYSIFVGMEEAEQKESIITCLA